MLLAALSGVDVVLSLLAGAAGKLEVAEARGEHVPEGWLIDKHGNPTTDPSTVKDGGAIKPMGGNEGYKGYALAAMVEILSGLLTGLGFGVEPTGKHNDGCLVGGHVLRSLSPGQNWPPQSIKERVGRPAGFANRRTETKANTQTA